MTTERSDITIRDRRVREGTRWLVEHNSGRELSQAEVLEWSQWNTDADNRSEYAELRHLYARLQQLPPLEPPSDAELEADLLQDAEEFPQDWNGRSGQPVHAISVLRPPQIMRRSLPIGRIVLAASVAILVIVVSIFLFRERGSASSPQLDSWQMYSTTLGQQRRIPLPDGSVVNLTGDTILRVRVPATGPRTVVLDRGEAIFHVRHKPKEGFTVLAGNGCIQSIGTVFDVRRYSTRVHVTVTEGAVNVAPRPLSISIDDSRRATDAQSQPIRLVQGQAIAYGMDGSAGAPQDADYTKAAEWPKGVISYVGTSLQEVVEDFQRYDSRKITLDPALADLQLSGTIDLRRVDDWLRTLPRIFPVEVVYQESNSVIILPRSHS